MMDEQMKSLKLFGSAIDAMEDGVFPIAMSFINEAIRYNPNFGEAYMIRALMNKQIGEPVYEDDLNQALSLNPDLEATILEIKAGRLTAQNHREWHKMVSGQHSTLSNSQNVRMEEQVELPFRVLRAWEGATRTAKDERLWRKDKFGAWIKKTEFNKTTDFGWRFYENKFQMGVYYAFHWENMTERSSNDEGWIKKVTSSGERNIPYKEGCYVASVCYGSSECEEVEKLRRYRDEVLHQNILGRLFIWVYYRVSPSLSKIIGELPTINKMIKNLIVDKILKLIK